MIKCTLFEFVRDNGRGCISDELKGDPRARAAFDARANDLRRHGVGVEETLNFCPHIKEGIYKLKIRFKPQLRPHLCKGPLDLAVEATFLVYAIEENAQLDPADPVGLAVKRRAIIEADSDRRKPI